MQLARPGRSALSEDVQNKLCPVEHFALGDFRKAVELSGREFAVEDDQRGLALQGQNLKFRQFAFTQNMPGMDVGYPLDKRPGHHDACAARQLPELFDVRFLYGTGEGRDGYEDRPGAVPRLRSFGEHAAKLLFQRDGFGVEIDVHAIPCGHGVDAVRLAVRVGGKQVPALKADGIAVIVDGQHGNAVQAQEQHVHQVFLRKPVRRKVRVHQADAAQTARRAAPARQFRDQDGRGIAHDNHIHLALPIDDEADLTPERT